MDGVSSARLCGLAKIGELVFELFLCFVAQMHGMLCDQVERVDVVTSDGKLRTLSASSDDSELFWALTRGGGAGTLAVVTSITFSTFPVPRACYHGHIEFPLSCWQAMTEALIRQSSVCFVFPLFTFFQIEAKMAKRIHLVSGDRNGRFAPDLEVSRVLCCWRGHGRAFG